MFLETIPDYSRESKEQCLQFSVLQIRFKNDPEADGFFQVDLTMADELEAADR